MIYYEWNVRNEDRVKQDIFNTINHVLDKFNKSDMDVEIMIADNEVIHALNKDYRNVDRATDVLSFPNFEQGLEDISSGYLGSIAISFLKAQEQAEEYGHSFKREICFLCTHGMLHLLGYDHVDPKEEKEMYALSEEILSELQINRV